MNDKVLRFRLIRLAHAQPALRPHLLPLLHKEAGGTISMAERLLEELLEDPEGRGGVEASDWGINVFRDEARQKGYDRSDMVAIFAEEARRLRGVEASPEALKAYIRMNRSGSKYRMSRRMRIGLFVQLAAKRELRMPRRAAKTWAQLSLIGELKKRGFPMAPYWMAEPKDRQRIYDIKRKAGGDKGKELRLALTMAKRIGGVEKAFRRGLAAEKAGDLALAQPFYQKALQLAGGPAMSVSAPAAGPKVKPKAPAVPSGLVPQDADEWELYSDMAGVGRAARQMTKTMTSALASLGRTVFKSQTAAARKKAVIKVVQRVAKVWDTYADWGASDTEPRYHARRTMRKYLALLLGVDTRSLDWDYPEVEAALDYI